MIRKHDDFVGSLIHDVAHLIRMRIDRKLKPFGITRINWLSLGILQKKPMMTQSELAEELETGAAACGRLVDRLESRKLIVRHQDESDRRARNLELAPDASALLESLKGLSTELREEILDGIPDEDLQIAENVLERMKKNLKSLVATVTSFICINSEMVAIESDGFIMQTIMSV